MQEVGKVIHFYNKIGVGVIQLSAALGAGDVIKVQGKTTDFEQTVGSMQVDHQEVSGGKKGDEVAIKLDSPAKEGDLIYKV